MSFQPPLRPGDQFFVPWRVARVDPSDGAVLVRMEDGSGGAVTLGVGTVEAHSGPFDHPPFWVHYRDESVPFEAFERAARTLGELLEATLPDGVEGVRRWLTSLGDGASQQRKSGARLNLVVSRDNADGVAEWCERQYEAGADSVELVVPVRAAPALGVLRELVRRLARRWANMPMGVHWRSQIGTPLCAFAGELGEVLLREPERVSIPDGTALGVYAEPCEECALRLACSGVAAEYGADEDLPALGAGVEPFVPRYPRATPHQCDWRDAARWLLTAQPGRRVRLSTLLPAERLRATPCHLPWTQLQLGAGGLFTPCSPENVRTRPRRSGGEDLEELWNGAELRAFRRALRDQAEPETCRSDCPVLRDGSRAPGRLELWGGSLPFVEAQIGIAEALLAGDEIVPGAPSTLQVSALSLCNYDCLMCRCGADGTRDDELPTGFWEGLRSSLGSVHTVLLTGGEPLLSRPLREFLGEVDEAAHPDVRLALATNGSLLDDALLDRLRASPIADVTVGLNAATPATYEAVNRGASWAAMRARLDALHTWRERYRPATALAYGLVVMRQNLDELEAFVELALSDGASPRFFLPRGDRNGTSVLLDPALAARAAQGLRAARARLVAAGAREAAGRLDPLLRRLDGLVGANDSTPP